MKFYSLVLFGVLCALSSMTHAQDTWKETGKLIRDVVCPPGKRPVEKRLCPEGTSGLLNCWRNTKVECVQDDQITSEPRDKLTTPVPVREPITWEKTGRSITGVDCRPGKRPVEMRLCPGGVHGLRNCWTNAKVDCVQDDQVTSEPGEKLTPTPVSVPATWRQTNTVVNGFVCPAGKRPVEMRLCPERSLRKQNCWMNIKVECVEDGQVTSQPREKLTTTPVPETRPTKFNLQPSGKTDRFGDEDHTWTILDSHGNKIAMGFRG